MIENACELQMRMMDRLWNLVFPVTSGFCALAKLRDT